MPYARPMKDLYERLRKVGFDASFVRDRVLPDWWTDDLAAKPANRAIAEAAISRLLRFPLARLRNPSATLELPLVKNVRLKRAKGIKAEEVRPALLLAEQVANWAVSAIPSLPPFAGVLSAKEVRHRVLSHRAVVSLDGLLEFAWEHGVVVLHLGELPKASKKFHGMALFCGGVPVVVLAFHSDSPPWLAFHLAHELGHIFLGHVAAHGPPLADGNIDQLDQDAGEKAADQFACLALTGLPEIELRTAYGLTAPKLVAAARQFGEQHGIDPGTVALVYGRSANRMPAAQAAVKLMGLDCGAYRKIGAALAPRLHRDDLPEATQRVLSLLSGL